MKATLYRWVWERPPGSFVDPGSRLYNVGIREDGTLHNPRGYPEETVRAAVLAANERRHARRSQSAQRAAQTRRRRHEQLVDQVAARFGQGYGPRITCGICGRGLDDPQSLARGIGSECWQDVLTAIERRKTERQEARG